MRKLLISIGGVLVLLAPFIEPALEFIGATCTPRSPIMQKLCLVLLIFWPCVALFFGVRTLLRDRQAAKSTKKKESV